MADRRSAEQFVANIERVASNFSGLYAGETILPLVHPFWSAQEIAKGMSLKAEWDVPDDLIPFYGDWHDLLCISSTTGRILLIDDDRSVRFRGRTPRLSRHVSRIIRAWKRDRAEQRTRA